MDLQTFHIRKVQRWGFLLMPGCSVRFCHLKSVFFDGTIMEVGSNCWMVWSRYVPPMLQKMPNRGSSDPRSAGKSKCLPSELPFLRYEQYALYTCFLTIKMERLAWFDSDQLVFRTSISSCLSQKTFSYTKVVILLVLRPGVKQPIGRNLGVD